MEAKMANIAQFFHIHLYVYCHGPVATSEFICTTNADKKRKKREIQMKRGQHSDDNNREREQNVYVLKFALNFVFYLVSQSDYGLLSTITAIVLLHH